MLQALAEAWSLRLLLVVSCSRGLGRLLMRFGMWGSGFQCCVQTRIFNLFKRFLSQGLFRFIERDAFYGCVWLGGQVWRTMRLGMSCGGLEVRQGLGGSPFGPGLSRVCLVEGVGLSKGVVSRRKVRYGCLDCTCQAGMKP